MTHPQARVKIPLTCGELVQGLYRGTPALVSCPINRYHTAQVQVRVEPGWILPDSAPKTRKTFQIGLEKLRHPPRGGTLTLISPAPPQRGYGTSTADIAASLFALGQAAGRPFSPQEVAEMATSVEPSDSTMFTGLTLFDHRQGSFHQHWGCAPPLSVIVIDPGGGVDTLAFNRQDFQRRLNKLRNQHQQAFQLLQEGIAKQAGDAVGKAATLSALAHQEILFNPHLENVIELGKEVHALGVCRAHSGTLLGLLLDPAVQNIHQILTYITHRLPGNLDIQAYTLDDGGPNTSPTNRKQRSNF